MRPLALLCALLFALPVQAGPPLLCHTFDTGGAPSLEWGGTGWNQPLADYQLDALVEQTESLLADDTPVIARMETLRRAAIYASRRGDTALALADRLKARIEAATTAEARALALFDSGYLLETLQEVLRIQHYDMPGIRGADTAALEALLREREDGSRAIDQALALQASDPALRFAAALVAKADRRQTDHARHAAAARTQARSDALLALNLPLLAP
jgi:hypothetical protein